MLFCFSQAEAIDRASSKAELTEETSPGSDRIDENQLTASEFRELSKEEIDLLNPDSNVQWDTMSGTSISSFFDQYEVIRGLNRAHIN